MRRAFITGIAGFAGSHLAGHLRINRPDVEVWGAHLGGSLDNLKGIDGLNLVKCDLLDSNAVSEAVNRARPDVIFHLAATASPAESFADPRGTLSNNIFSTLNVFEAALKHSPDAVILNIGSSEEYGEALELPVKETSEMRPMSPYAVSKASAGLLGFQYFKTNSLKVVRVRPFNHFGPFQTPVYVVPAFARQIAAIEAGEAKEKVLSVGNLESAKDFLDVRDVANAYVLLSEKGVPGETYNVSSGKAVKIREILSILLNLSKEKIEVVADPKKLRPGKDAVSFGDNSRLKALGWSQKVNLVDGLKAVLDYWRGACRTGNYFV